MKNAPTRDGDFVSIVDLHVPPTIFKPYSLTCDWGDCDELIVGFRYDAWGHGWLVVCSGHSGLEEKRQ